MNVFIAGPRAIKVLDADVVNRLSAVVANELTVLVGDANGVDKLTQQFLLSQKYRNVIVYASNGTARNNLGSWEVKNIPVVNGVKGFDFYTYKDRQMALDADYGFMVWNGISKGTLNNIINLTKSGKKALLYYTPHRKFYCLEELEQVEKFVAACGNDAQKLFTTLTYKGVKTSPESDSSQISLFG